MTKSKQTENSKKHNCRFSVESKGISQQYCFLSCTSVLTFCNLIENVTQLIKIKKGGFANKFMLVVPQGRFCVMLATSIPLLPFSTPNPEN